MANFRIHKSSYLSQIQDEAMCRPRFVLIRRAFILVCKAMIFKFEMGGWGGVAEPKGVCFASRFRVGILPIRKCGVRNSFFDGGD